MIWQSHNLIKDRRRKFSCIKSNSINKIGAVSPAALPTLIIVPVKIPGKAAGKTTLKIVWVLVAPSAKDASAKSFGTVFIASTVEFIIIGRIRTAKVSAPEIRLTPNFRPFTNIAKPKRPKTIEGIPERVFIDILITLTSHNGFAYSVKKTAVNNPTGNAKITESTVKRKLP